MDRNPLDFPNPARLADFSLNVIRLFEILPEGWIFAGVMRRAGADTEVTDDRWVAIATLEGSKALGPIPEARGIGSDMISAVVDLRTTLAEELGISDETASF